MLIFGLTCLSMPCAPLRTTGSFQITIPGDAMNLLHLIRRRSKSKSSKTLRGHRHLHLESLESRRVLTGLNPTGMEQEMLELVNRVRMNPEGEPDELFISTDPGNPNFFRSTDAGVNAAFSAFGTNGTAFLSDWASETAAPPLAWNEGLQNASLAHNNEMVNQNAQSHQLPGEDPLLTRAENGGYDWSGSVSVGENVFAFTENNLHGHTAFIVDWGTGPNGMQSPPGHRDNIMDSKWEEVGISIISSPFSGSGDVGPFVMTQDFGTRANYGSPRVLGVAFTDADGDNFYDDGEGLGGVTIEVSNASNTFTTTTMTAGGYQVAVPAGTYNVVASGGSLAQPLSLGSVTVGTENVKIDLETSSAPPAGGQVAGTLFVDTNENGFVEVGENRLSGWTVFVDINSNGVLDGGEMSATTNSNGLYTIDVSAAGTFDVTFVENSFFRISAGSNVLRSETVTIGETTPNVNFGLINFASASGSTLNIFGTANADQFDWTLEGGNHVVQVGEQTFEYDAATYDTIQFFGSGDEDSINLVGTPADETATINRGFMTITDGTYTLNATSFEDVDLDMVSGTDEADMNDGAEDDDMIAHPTFGRLIADSYNHYVANADRLNVYATAGGNDRAYMYDGPTDDRYIGRPDFSIFRGNNFEFYTYMEGFERNFGYSTNGGEDYSFFYDSAGNDNFFGRSDYAAMQDTSISYFNYASGFERNFAYSTAGGFDNAFLTDGATDDSFFGRDAFSILRGKNFEFFNRAEGFDVVRAYSNAGNDNATFFDSTGNDVFEGFTNFSQMTMGSIFNYAQMFSEVIAYSDNGGTDMAVLHDSSGSDTFFADDGYGFMSGTGYFNRVDNFENVEIESSRGGTDVSTVIDPILFTLNEVGPWG